MNYHMSAYRAYLLRLWPAANGQCRALLESPATGARHGFVTLEALQAFLARELEGAARDADELVDPEAGDYYPRLAGVDARRPVSDDEGTSSHPHPGHPDPCRDDGGDVGVD